MNRQAPQKITLTSNIQPSLFCIQEKNKTLKNSLFNAQPMHSAQQEAVKSVRGAETAVFITKMTALPQSQQVNGQTGSLDSRQRDSTKMRLL